MSIDRCQGCVRERESLLRFKFGFVRTHLLSESVIVSTLLYARCCDHGGTGQGD